MPYYTLKRVALKKRRPTKRRRTPTKMRTITRIVYRTPSYTYTKLKRLQKALRLKTLRNKQYVDFINALTGGAETVTPTLDRPKTAAQLAAEAAVGMMDDSNGRKRMSETAAEENL